jgi:NAD(P) transhydrogenase
VNRTYDLVVIGAGPAGEKGAVQAAYYGKRVVVVERAKDPGGAAVHTGTLPSKTLRETAIFLSGYRQQELYGLRVEINQDTAVPRLLSRKNAVREQEVARMRWNFDRHDVEVVHGAARFLDAHTVEVPTPGGVQRLSAERFLVATGSKPHRPDNIPFDDEDVDDSDTILGLDRLPATMIVIGGGVIGCEYASMFAAMGVNVTLIEPRPRLLPFLDLEIGERLRGALHAHGVRLELGQTVGGVQRREKRSIVVTLASGRELWAEKVLIASGRSGQTEGLRLADLGVELDKRGYVKVDANYATRVPSIYAVGDVIGFPALASTSMEQARVAVCRAFGFDYKQTVSTLLPYGIYTIPEVSCVGLSEEDAAAKGIDVFVGRAFYRDNARGKIIGDKDGMIKLLFERSSRKLVGCHCIGDRASELVHIGQAVITLGGGIETFIDMVFNFPTLSEVYKYAAYDALAALTRATGESSRQLIPRASEKPPA